MKILSLFKKQIVFLVLLATLLIWASYSFFSEGLIYAVLIGDISSVIEKIQSFGVFAQVVLILLVILEVVFAPVPPLILYVIAGILFGGFYGGILVLIGNLIGALIDFEIGRLYLHKGVERKFSQKFLDKFNQYTKKYGVLAIFLLRINPLTTTDLVSYLAGATEIKRSYFLFSTALGLIPLIFIKTYGGDVISTSPLFLGLTILFSVLYMAVFLYFLFGSFGRKEK